jgi:ATP-binding cassette subfamily B multidrug efflux pump
MGTHQQLLAQRGIYYKLYQLQYKDQEVSVARAPSTANIAEPTVSADH